MNVNLKVILFALVVGAASHSSFAQEAGVRCDSQKGFLPDYNSTNKILRCVKTERVVRESKCPPQTALQNITMDPDGSDTCLPIGGGNRVPSGIFSLPGDPAGSEFRREVVASGPDRMIADKKSYEYPIGHIFPGLNPERGVRCPADGNDRVRFSGITLTCRDVVADSKRSYCTPGWGLIVRKGKDVCRSIVGNEDPTLPEGHISRAGWTLDEDGGAGNHDVWTRTTSRWEWPVMR